MPSNHAKIWKALKTYLEGYPTLPMVAYGGQSFDPPVSAETPYMIVDDVRFDAQRKYLGTNAPAWQTGNLAVHVMVPLSYDDIQSAECVGKIADYFVQDTPMTYDDITIKVSRPATVSGAGYRDVGYFRVPILVSWEGWI